MHPQFIQDVIDPLKGKELYDIEVCCTGGGTLQRMALILALGSYGDMYLIDEPCAYLDADQKIAVAKVIKRFVMKQNCVAVVATHDIIVATYLADRVIVFEGEAGKKGRMTGAQSLLCGMNTFLKNMDVTMRRDSVNWRPRINKRGSRRDVEQRKINNYFYLDASD